MNEVEQKENKARSQMLQFLSSELLHVIFSLPRRPSITSPSSIHPSGVKLLLQEPLVSLFFSIPTVTIKAYAKKDLLKLTELEKNFANIYWISD